MEKREVNASALAKIIGVSHVAVGNFLDGQVPKADHLYAIAKYFGVTMESLIAEEVQPGQRPLARLMELPPSQTTPAETERVVQFLELEADFKKLQRLVSVLSEKLDSIRPVLAAPQPVSYKKRKRNQGDLPK